jgi:tetratricopeptide (TPR) repeat protein
VLGKYLEVPEGAEEAERAFQRAMTLNPELPVLHKYYAQLECDAGRATDAMARLLRRAQAAVDPEYFAGLVHACRYAGLLEASLAAHQEARRLDPTIQTSVINTYYALGDFERIVRDDDLGDPDSKSLALYRLGRRDEALATWQRLPAEATPFLKAWEEMILACLSESPDARAIAERAIGMSTWTDPEGDLTSGLILARLGSDEMAIARLRAAVEGGFCVPQALAGDPWLAPLRRHPRFGEILRLAQARRDHALAVFRAEGGERLLGLRAAA